MCLTLANKWVCVIHNQNVFLSCSKSLSHLLKILPFLAIKQQEEKRLLKAVPKL